MVEHSIIIEGNDLRPSFTISSSLSKVKNSISEVYVCVFVKSWEKKKKGGGGEYNFIVKRSGGFYLMSEETGLALTIVRAVSIGSLIISVQSVASCLMVWIIVLKLQISIKKHHTNI